MSKEVLVYRDVEYDTEIIVLGFRAYRTQWQSCSFRIVYVDAVHRDIQFVYWSWNLDEVFNIITTARVKHKKVKQG